jgi:GNAT superfamily N-acetyltransferase
VSDAPTRIVRVADVPALIPELAHWLWEAFWRHDGHTEAETADWLATANVPRGIPQCFVAVQDARPVGVASLVRHDLPERPDLTPWLANVFVPPEARGRGLASRLVRRVEQAAAEIGTRTLWLYTGTAEGLYTRLGWETVEIFQRYGEPHKLMRRHFAASTPPEG